MLKSRAAIVCLPLSLLACALLISEPAISDEIVYYGDEPATLESASDGFGDGSSTCVSDENSCVSDGGSTCCHDGNGDDACGDDDCSAGCDAGCGCWCRRQCASQQESWYNCGCNGSYKFPVPPLYTYMWPGLYSQQLVTDYHSPWRFPPLKPYTNEAPTGEPFDSASSQQMTVRQVSAEVATRATANRASKAVEGRRVESTSERVRRLYDIR